MIPSRGSRVGSCEILDQLGEGGVCAAYRALHPRLDREIAIEVLRDAVGQ